MKEGDYSETGTFAPGGNCQPNLQLIPIQLDIELDQRKLKDFFLWDKNEPYWDMETFARILVEDLALPPSFEPEIVSQLKKQVN